jgi:hypothetical protein
MPCPWPICRTRNYGCWTPQPSNNSSPERRNFSPSHKQLCIKPVRGLYW